MKRYPHHLVITRPSSSAAQNQDTGALAALPADTVYDGDADVQDVEGDVLAREADGTMYAGANAVAYIKESMSAVAIKPGDNAVVGWGDGTTTKASVLGRARIDARVFLEWIN